MSLAYTDKVQITNITQDATHGTHTEGTPFTSKAYIEDDTELRYDQNGSPSLPIVRVFLPSNVSISMGDKVQITKMHGRTPTTDEARERFVRRAPRIGGGNVSHLEVLV